MTTKKQTTTQSELLAEAYPDASPVTATTTANKKTAPKEQKKTTLPRGIRNNNPLNICKGDKWLGLSPKQTDPKFCQFTEAKFGYRAALVVLRRYMLAYSLNTVAAIVQRWAPDGGAGYVDVVCRHMGVHAHQPLSYWNRTQMTSLLEGMTIAENGRKADRQAIEDAFTLL